MDDFGAGLFGEDGTQAPPPPRVFPDPLAGLVTGERYDVEAVPPVVVPPPVPLPQPGPAYVPPARRPARGQALRPAQHSRPARQVPGQASGQVSTHASGHVSTHVSRQVSGQPAAHVPHAEPARRQPEQAVVQEGPKKSRGGLIGCLVVLAALSGLLFNVVREIIEAVVDLLR
ncbi:hypothetical protein [Saccharothrix deserti]|uniref:hypothetical protein n=1 Tax=Saccharothrix deserti TaxID=2593674 RepID=UPI00131BD5F9|nr:hypothetical protein [Saccharothrix deserti]